MVTTVQVAIGPLSALSIYSSHGRTLGRSYQRVSTIFVSADLACSPAWRLECLLGRLVLRGAGYLGINQKLYKQSWERSLAKIAAEQRISASLQHYVMLSGPGGSRSSW
jgi:hypothetical protein